MLPIHPSPPHASAWDTGATSPAWSCYRQETIHIYTPSTHRSKHSFGFARLSRRQLLKHGAVGLAARVVLDNLNVFDQGNFTRVASGR